MGDVEMTVAEIIYGRRETSPYGRRNRRIRRSAFPGRPTAGKNLRITE